MLLRSAEPADASAVAAVHVRTWQATYRGLLPDLFLDGLDVERWAERYTFDDPDPNRPRTILAVEAGAVCGFATIAPAGDADRQGAGEIIALYVDPARQGFGVGRTLIAEARARLAGRGFTTACLWVLVGNRRAERFYRVDGWVLDGAWRRQQFGGRHVVDVRYWRQLV
ncbi:MAG: GNAT family N-acetyltransferase [Solirubrobacteraceae bacterium]|jgi:GNAT superfamily N-acetyltransferase